jgi:two-component system response regulator QseB
MRILLVEDDAILRGGIKAGLTLEGLTVDDVGTAQDARLAVTGSDYDAVVLDVGLPDGSGLTVLEDWRRAGDTTPVILLTARNMVDDRIGGLNAGADDYLGKPFDLDELIARIRAIARRAKGNASACLEVAGLTLDVTRRELRRGDVPIPLSRRELALLEMLFEQPGRIFSRSQLEDRLYGWGEEVGSNAVEVHVHKLRAKLGKKTIETVRGQGYRTVAS